MDGFVNSTLGVIITQALGFLAMGAGLVSFQMQKRSTIIAFQVLCNVLFIIQLAMLCKVSGVLFNTLGLVRGIIYSMRGKYKWADARFIPVTFIALIVGSSIILSVYESPFALLPAGAMTLVSISQFMRSENLVRIIALPASPLWIIYHLVYSGSLGGWLGEIFIILSILVSLIRYREAQGKIGNT